MPPRRVRGHGVRHAAGDAPGYLMAGDALRALAALSVVGFHAEQGVAYGLGDAYRADPALVSPIGPLLAQGSAGVWVFFALSGYLVGGPFVRAWLRGTPRPGVRRYLARRLRRIVPAFWVVLALVLIRFGTYDHDAGEILRLFAFAQNIGTAEIDGVLPQGWTLGCELGFYLALPLIALAAARISAGPCGRGARRMAFLLVLTLVVVLSLTIRALDDTGPLTLTTAATAWAFAPGLLLAALEDDLRPRLRDSARGRIAGVVLLLLGAVLFGVVTRAGPDTAPLAGELLRAVAAGLLVCAAVVWQWATAGAPGFTQWPAVHALGRWSDGIYLVHVAAGRELRRHLPTGLSVDVQLAASLGGMVAGSIVAAALLWWLVEEPALSGRRPSWARARATSPPRPSDGARPMISDQNGRIECDDLHDQGGVRRPAADRAGPSRG